MHAETAVTAEPQRGFTLPRRLAASVAVVGMALAGCSFGSEGKSPTEGETAAGALTDLGSMDPVTASLYAEAIVRVDLTSSTAPDIMQADRTIAAATHADPRVRVRLTRMSQLRAGEAYLTEISSDIDADPAAVDPQLRLPEVPKQEESMLLGAVSTDITGSKVETTLVSDGPNKFAAARHIVATGHIGAGPRRELLRYIDGEQAQAIFSDFSEFSGDPATALRAIHELHDPQFRQLALAEFQTTLAKSIQTKLNMREMTKAQATATAAKYLPAGLRAQTLAAIDTWLAPYTYEDYETAWGLVQDAYYTAATAYNDGQSDLPSTVPDITSEVAATLDSAYERTETEVNMLLGRLVAGQNRIALDAKTAGKELAPLNIDPRTPIDLTGVSGTKAAPDLHDLDTYTNPDLLKELSEFAEVTIVNGEPVLAFHANDKLTDDAKKLITVAFNHVRPLLLSAFKSGELNRVRLTIASDFRPYYRGDIREQIMALPADDSTSIEQLAAIWTHETVHSLVRNVFDGNVLTKGQNDLIVQACSALKTTLYERMQVTVNTSHAQLATLQRALKPPHRAIITALEKAAKAGNLDDDLLKLHRGRSDAYNNDCAAADSVAADAIYDYAILHDINIDDLDYVFDLPAFKAFSQTLYTQVVDSDIFTKLNEANYVRTDWYGRELLGHSEDNANELRATVMDAVLNFGTEFGAVIRDMEPEDKKATLQTVDMAARIVLAQHPELAGIVMEAVVRTRKAAA